MAGIIKVDRVQSDSNLAFNIGGSNVAYFNTDGINMTGNQIITGSGILRTTSGMLYANNGIAFPGTQSSSSDPNVLDDYEEGTWTPSVNLLGTLSGTYSSGFYVKIGKNVFLSWAYYTTSSDTTQDGSVMYITGLPFTVASGNAFGTSCLLTERMYGTQSATVPNTFHVSPEIGTSTLRVMQNNYNGTITNASYFVSQLRSSYKGGTQYIYGNCWYTT